LDEVDHAIRDMSVVKCGGCRWRRFMWQESDREMQWQCRNEKCGEFSYPIHKDDNEDCGWWEPRSLLARIRGDN